MQLDEAQALAELYIKFHGLNTQWSFGFHSARRVLGRCNYDNFLISLSKEYVLLNNELLVINTILHEIAHALVGTYHGHDHVWRAKALAIGCNGERCGAEEVVKAKGKWIHKCLNCHMEKHLYRKPKVIRSCGKCSPRFDTRYILQVIPA